jgi:hypothetical protein
MLVLKRVHRQQVIGRANSAIDTRVKRGVGKTWRERHGGNFSGWVVDIQKKFNCDKLDCFGRK